jgi:hypothetical protein
MFSMGGTRDQWHPSGDTLPVVEKEIPIRQPRARGHARTRQFDVGTRLIPVMWALRAVGSSPSGLVFPCNRPGASVIIES